MRFYIPNRQPLRLHGYDYSKPGDYFITICTLNKQPIFGSIHDSIMQLSNIGIIVNEELISLPLAFDCIRLNTYIVMPNHIHAIIKITKSQMKLGDIVSQYKSRCTKRVRKDLHDNEALLWHRAYNDHIIRNVAELKNFQDYIRNNPIKWQDDEFYPKNS